MSAMMMKPECIFDGADNKKDLKEEDNLFSVVAAKNHRRNIPFNYFSPRQPANTDSALHHARTVYHFLIEIDAYKLFRFFQVLNFQSLYVLQFDLSSQLNNHRNRHRMYR